MRRAVRASFALGALLVAFVALSGCGQRGPLTLPGSTRPSARPEQSKSPPAAVQSSEAAPAEPAPRSEDEERRNGE